MKKINDHVPVGITITNDYSEDVNNEIDSLSGRNKKTPEFWMDRRVMAQKKQKTYVLFCRVEQPLRNNSMRAKPELIKTQAPTDQLGRPI